MRERQLPSVSSATPVAEMAMPPERTKRPKISSASLSMVTVTGSMVTAQP